MSLYLLFETFYVQRVIRHIVYAGDARRNVCWTSYGVKQSFNIV